MGSSAYSCSISNLPIHGGEPVRALLLTEGPYYPPGKRTCYIYDHWFVRSPVIRARYNDYGGIGDENSEDCRIQLAWMAALELDMVEIGTGDNQCHDVPCRRGQTWEQLQNALQEGRVHVLRNYEPDKGQFDDLRADTPKGVPTLQRVEALLGKKAKNFDIDEARPGWVRVRVSGFGGRDTSKLRTITPLFSDYQTLLCAGSGSYANAADLWLTVKVGTKDWHGGESAHAEGPLAVAQALIREDVWQALLTMKVPGLSLAKMRKRVEVDWKRARKAYRTQAELAASREKLLGLEDERITKLLLKTHLILRHVGDCAWRDPVPFKVALAEHVRLLLQMEDPIIEGADGPPPEGLAELLYIQNVLSWACYQWHPATGAGPQFGEWAVHAQLHQALAGIAGKKLRQERKERRQDG